MLKLGMDMGGSEFRLTDGVSIERFETDIKEIDVNSVSNERDIEDDLLDMVIESHPNKRFAGRRFVKGEAMGFYKGRLLTQDNSAFKVEQDTIYINCIYAIARYLTLNKSREGEPLKTTVLLPVTEYFKKTPDLVEKLKSELAGNITVRFPMRNNKTVTFKLDKQSIRVGGEGMVTLMKYKNLPGFESGIKIIIDTGKDTTDITLVKGTEILGYASASERIGGSNIESIVLNALNKREIAVSREAVRKALCSNYILKDDILVDETAKVAKARETYKEKEVPSALTLEGFSEEDVNSLLHKFYIMDGAAPTDITEEVVDAKRRIAKTMYDSIKSAFDTQMLHINEASMLICLGRPFTGLVTDSDCLANLLANNFQKKIITVQVDNPHLANAQALQDACR